MTTPSPTVAPASVATKVPLSPMAVLVMVPPPSTVTVPPLTAELVMVPPLVAVREEPVPTLNPLAVLSVMDVSVPTPEPDKLLTVASVEKLK